MRPIVANLRTLIYLCTLHLVVSLAYGASQPWDKAAAEWTQADMDRLLAGSPWSQQVSATVVDPYDAVEHTQAPLPGAHEAGLAGPSNDRRWDGGPGRNRMGRLPTVPVTVRWESALPIREALRRTEASSAFTGSPETAAYVIELVGLVPGGKYHAAGGPRKPALSRSDGQTSNTTDPGDPEEVIEAFMSFSRLRPSSGAEIRPDNVRLDPATGAVHIFFPRTQTFDRHQKEVQFTTHFGSLHVQTKFRVSAMTYQGQIAL